MHLWPKIMNSDPANRSFNRTDDEILTYQVSDEALEAACIDRGRVMQTDAPQCGNSHPNC